MSLARGTIALTNVRKSFRSYTARSVKDAIVAVARGDGVGERRTVLDGISLVISPGERVGIIGKNGGGKSTLFRILSGILVPDSGDVHVAGRVAPLIEVTAGFVLDMTGAENLRLNAAILGVTRREIEAKAERIVEFAGLHEFMDTPVRYYSSGMQARLGFSVVAHVDADVLLIDEVLAVGDVEFQARCLTRLQEVASSGTTVVFVSHDHDAVRRFCHRTLWLDAGQIRADGKTDEVIRERAAAG